MKLSRLLPVVLAIGVLLCALPVQPVTAKFRDAINFEDNQFVGISNTEAFHRYRSLSGSDSESIDGTILDYQVTSGLMSFFELGARVPVYFYENGTQGAGDFSVFQRFKFQQEQGMVPASSGGIELIFPTGDETSTPPIGTDSLNARLFGTIGQTIAPSWIWLANGGVTFYGDNQYDDRLEYNASLRYQPSSGAKFMFEWLGETGGLKDESELYFAPGAGFQAESGFDLMLTAPIGLTDESTDLKPTVQFSHEF